MAHQTTTHRRNLATFDPKQTIDPATKRHPIPTTITTEHHHQDPTKPPPTTIQTISNHFTKLYSNHKILSNLKKGPTFHLQNPCVDTQHFQALKDNSCTTLTKSKSQHGRQIRGIEKQRKIPFEVHYVDSSFANQKAHGIKKQQPSLSKKECKNKEFCYEEKNDGGIGDEMIRRPSFSLPVNGGGAGGRRRSFCSSETELGDFFLCSGVKVVSVDMPPFMQMHVVDCARKAHDSLEKFTARTLASTLKKEFDGVYGPAWHCIVGTSFGSFVTHSVGGFMYFSMDHKLYVLLFKTTVQKAQ